MCWSWLNQIRSIHTLAWSQLNSSKYTERKLDAGHYNQHIIISGFCTCPNNTLKGAIKRCRGQVDGAELPDFLPNCKISAFFCINSSYWECLVSQIRPCKSYVFMPNYFTCCRLPHVTNIQGTGLLRFINLFGKTQFLLMVLGYPTWASPLGRSINVSTSHYKGMQSLMMLSLVLIHSWLCIILVSVLRI